MASLPTRIRRISLDAGEPANYTLAATSAYDASDPAGTSASWGSAAEVEYMDQVLSVTTAAGTTVSHEGGLIEFVRTPTFFLGCIVKVNCTYDIEAGEVPELELWTRDATTAVWLKRRGIEFASTVGAPTGRTKYFDLRLAVPVENIDAVWVTMNPGAVGTPSIAWLCIHCFGLCQAVPQYDGSCELDPSTDCIETDPCLDRPESCLDPELDCEDIDPTGELCNDPPFTWPTPPPEEGGPVPRFQPPNFPAIDLCDPAAVAAFKEVLTAEQLAFFEELLSTVEFPCLDDTNNPVEVGPINVADPTASPFEPLLPKQPMELYYPPETPTEPETDPRDPDQIDVSGQGGAGDPSTYVGFFFYGISPTVIGETYHDFFVSSLGSASFEVASAYGERDDTIDDPSPFPTGNGFQLTFSGAAVGSVVSIRIIALKVSGLVHTESTELDGDGYAGLLLEEDLGLGVFGVDDPVPGSLVYTIDRDLGFSTDIKQFGFLVGFPPSTGGFYVRVVVQPPAPGTVVVVGSNY